MYVINISLINPLPNQLDFLTVLNVFWRFKQYFQVIKGYIWYFKLLLRVRDVFQVQLKCIL